MNEDDLQHPRRSAEESNFLADVFERADPQVAAFMARHNALLERVTVLERALERLANPTHLARSEEAALIQGEVADIARKALDG